MSLQPFSERPGSPFCSRTANGAEGARTLSLRLAKIGIDKTRL